MEDESEKIEKEREPLPLTQCVQNAMYTLYIAYVFNVAILNILFILFSVSYVIYHGKLGFLV